MSARYSAAVSNRHAPTAADEAAYAHRAAEQARSAAQRALVDDVERLPVPFATATPLPHRSMIQAAVDAFIRARRATLARDEVLLGRRFANAYGNTGAPYHDGAPPAAPSTHSDGRSKNEQQQQSHSDAAQQRAAHGNSRSHESVASEPGALAEQLNYLGGARGSCATGLLSSERLATMDTSGATSSNRDADDGTLRAELDTLRATAGTLREEATALLARLRGCAEARNTLATARMQEHRQQHDDQAGDPDADDAGSDVSVMTTALADHLRSAASPSSKRTQQRRRGHSTVRHAVEQARMGYGGSNLKLKHRAVAAVSAEELAMEEVRLDEARRVHAALLGVLSQRLGVDASAI